MTNLITLQEFKTYEGIRSDTEDARIFALIGSVSQLVKTYCSNSFVDYIDTPKEEYFSIDYETDQLFLTESPVIDIVEVHLRDKPNLEYRLVPSEEYSLNTFTDSLYRFTTSGASYNWPKGPNSVKVSYLAGYIDFPTDLKLAVIDLINYYKEDEHRPLMSAGSATRQNPEESRRSPHFPPHIKRVLDLYKIYT